MSYQINSSRELHHPRVHFRVPSRREIVLCSTDGADADQCPKGTKAEFLVYHPKMSYEVPSVYDHPPTYILEGFVCRLRYRSLWEGGTPPSAANKYPQQRQS